jgi:hypothetical protein
VRSSRGEKHRDEVLEKVKPRNQNWTESSHILENFERRVFESLFGNELEFFFLGDRFSTPFAFPLFLRSSCSIARDARRESARSLSLSH